MKKLIAHLAPAAALAMTVVPAGAATVIPVGATGNPFFSITGQTATDNFVTANFGATFGSNATFDDIFMFYLPLTGKGSGSVSTSSSSIGTFLKITEVLINGVSQSVPGAAYPGISNFPITAFTPNMIEIKGFTDAATKFGTFTGTATFSASPVPETATWATFLLGFGILGLRLRRKSNLSHATA